jgi:hypothetical protein
MTTTGGRCDLESRMITLTKIELIRMRSFGQAEPPAWWSAQAGRHAISVQLATMTRANRVTRWHTVDQVSSRPGPNRHDLQAGSRRIDPLTA